MDFMLNIVSENTNVVAYKPKRTCNNLKLPHFKNCFKRKLFAYGGILKCVLLDLWKEVPTVKKCLNCKNTCTLSSNLCGSCLKPYIHVKGFNMVFLFDDEKDNTLSVTIGESGDDFEKVIEDCIPHLELDDDV